MNMASELALPAMTLAAVDDQQLVGAARRGDDRAFEELYERYRPRIRAFATRMTHDPDRAEDVTQEVFISALRRLRETHRPIAFRPWIYEIARNACIDEHRRSQRVVEVPIEGDGDDSWLNHLSAGPTPEVAMESKMQLEDLQGAFGALSERHHRIIVARELEGKSYRQIGRELGMSQVVVESTLFRARRRLNEEFEDLNTGRRCAHVRGILEALGARAVRRLGLRDRRAVSRHIAQCQPCRREALAVGFTAQLRPVRALEKAAAAIFPVPLLRLLRRGASVAGTAARHVQQGAATAASPVSGYIESMASAGAGRLAATAVTVLAAAVGGGLVTEAAQAPAHPPAAHAVLTGAHSSTARTDTTLGQRAGGRPAWARTGAHPGTRHPGSRRVGGASRAATPASQTRPGVAPGAGTGTAVPRPTPSRTGVARTGTHSVSAATGHRLAGALDRASKALRSVGATVGAAPSAVRRSTRGVAGAVGALAAGAAR